MEQPVFRTIGCKLIVLCEEAVCTAKVLAQVLCELHLAAQCEEVLLASDIVTTDSSFHYVPYSAKKFGDEHLKQRHSRGKEFGIFCLDMPESSEATQHFNQ